MLQLAVLWYSYLKIQCRVQQIWTNEVAIRPTFSVQLHLVRCRFTADRERQCLALREKSLYMKTNWGKSQLPPEILLQTTFPFCITWHPKTHQHNVNTGDEDYWLVKSRSNGIAFRKRIKKKKKNSLAEPWQYHNWLTSIFGDQFLQSIMCRFYSPSEMQSWWSQGAQWDFEVQKSWSQRWKIHSPGFSPLRFSDLEWTEWNWANWK